MPTIRTKTTYLEMLAPPEKEQAAERSDVVIARLERPSIEEYRKLYRGVGDAFHWVDRVVMPDGELAAILRDDRVEVHVLKVAGELAGFAELDCREPGEVELAYLGLLPTAIGRGLGKFLLNGILQRAWSHAPRRVWVHTCDLDHVAALPNYLRAGFQVYDQREIDQWIPDT